MPQTPYFKMIMIPDQEQIVAEPHAAGTQLGEAAANAVNETLQKAILRRAGNSVVFQALPMYLLTSPRRVLHLLLIYK
jgi:hypothetical protein